MTATIEQVQACGADAIVEINEALTALHLSPAREQAQALDALQTAMIANDPKAIARKVGFFGRLLGRDITLQAQAEALRGQLVPLVHHARKSAEIGMGYARSLDIALDRLLHGGDALQQSVRELSADRIDAGDDTTLAAAIDGRIAHLERIAAMVEIGRAQMLASRDSHRLAAGLANQLATHCKLIIDQQVGLRSAAEMEHALSQAQGMARSAINAFNHPAPSASPSP